MYCQRCEELCRDHAAEADRRQAEFDRRDEIARLAQVLALPFPPQDRKTADLVSRLIVLKETASIRLLGLIARDE